MADFSKTQIDRLGDRLRKGPHTEADLRMLDDYRRSFGDAYNEVVRVSRERGQSPTGRSAKSTGSIVEKLCRESIRLSQMQDIAGCRVVVTGMVEQEQVLASLRAAYPAASVVDRREKPSHGYRAVHVIASVAGKPIEIQVRTFLQHLWAELSEKATDVFDPLIKYGGGSDEWRSLLTDSCEWVAAYERLEATYEKLKRTGAELLKGSRSGHRVQEIGADLEESRREVEVERKMAAKHLNKMIAALDERRRQRE